MGNDFGVKTIGGRIYIGDLSGVPKAPVSTDEELAVCERAITCLGRDRDLFGVENRTDSYTTLVYKGSDFLRVKFTPKAHWLSIAIANKDVDDAKDDSLFALQKNKNQRHWKAAIESVDDVQKFIKYLENACDQVDEFGY